MDVIRDRYDELVRSAARRLTGGEPRSFIAEVTLTLCDGKVRRAERPSGWGRQPVQKGWHDRRSGLRWAKPSNATARKAMACRCISTTPKATRSSSRGPRPNSAKALPRRLDAWPLQMMC